MAGGEQGRNIAALGASDKAALQAACAKLQGQQNSIDKRKSLEVAASDPNQHKRQGLHQNTIANQVQLQPRNPSRKLEPLGEQSHIKLVPKPSISPELQPMSLTLDAANPNQNKSVAFAADNRMHPPQLGDSI